MKKVRGFFIKFLWISILATFLLTGCGGVEDSTAQDSVVQDSTVEDSMIEDSTVEDSTIEDSTIQNSFTITFDSDGGRKVQSQVKQKNELVEEPSLVYKIVYNDGEYELEGWYFGEIKWDFDTMKVQEDMVLKARWNKIEDYPKPEI